MWTSNRSTESNQSPSPRGGGGADRSSVHRAIQDVRHGVLYSTFVEKKERDQIMIKVTLTLSLNYAMNRYIRSSNMFRYKEYGSFARQD